MNWIEWKALHELYCNEEVTCNQTLTASNMFRYLERSLAVVEQTAKKFIALEGFKGVYEKHYEARFNQYQAFLQEQDLLKPQTRFEDSDLDVLMKIKEGMDSGELHPLRDQIIEADESLRGVSLMFFKNEKYLLGRPSLVNALKSLLQVVEFSNEKDQQYIYKLECAAPKVIVLCENLDFLTKPNKPRQWGIELWYAGGKNIQKLQYADTRGLSIYYSCDWDYDGLLIYSWVRKIISNIELLSPTGLPRSIVRTEHNSHWVHSMDNNTVCGLPKALFSDNQLALIQDLITNKEWVVEESNDLIAMLQKAGWTPS